MAITCFYKLLLVFIHKIPSTIWIKIFLFFCKTVNSLDSTYCGVSKSQLALSLLLYILLHPQIWPTFFYKFTFFLVFIFEREKERKRQSVSRGGAERGRHRIQCSLQALSCQHRACCGAWTCELWDHDLSPLDA